MFSSLFRIVETRSLKPLRFTNINVEYIDDDIDDIGIYVHIPFCITLCPFCPYNKIRYDREIALRYKEALIKEIYLIGSHYKEKNITSIYFGGGTPSLMIDELEDIIVALNKVFNIECNIGIELHPRDITEELAYKLKNIGFTMVSVGIQSFQAKELNTLGREFIDGNKKIRILKDIGFKVIDVDLIFGIKGQTVEDLKKDFMIAFENGATQVSTYPFIDFSYAKNKTSPLGSREKRRLLHSLEKLRKDLKLSRTAVWTFGKKDVPKYSSITRDAYIGFGASAASLTKKYFKLNTFGVEEYIQTVNNGRNPKALTMDFNQRTRALYWGFWNAYTLEFKNDEFKKMFNKDIKSFFAVELLIAQLLGIIRKNKKDYRLTDFGIYLYHLIEQHYTHQYIDKTWRVCGQNPWPEKIDLY